MIVICSFFHARLKFSSAPPLSRYSLKSIWNYLQINNQHGESNDTSTPSAARQNQAHHINGHVNVYLTLAARPRVGQ